MFEPFASPSITISLSPIIAVVVKLLNNGSSFSLTLIKLPSESRVVRLNPAIGLVLTGFR